MALTIPSLQPGAKLRIHEVSRSADSAPSDTNTAEAGSAETPVVASQGKADTVSISIDAFAARQQEVDTFSGEAAQSGSAPANGPLSDWAAASQAASATRDQMLSQMDLASFSVASTHVPSAINNLLQA